MDPGERKRLQKVARDKQLSEIQQSLADASRSIDDSKREIRRSQGLLQDRRGSGARDDNAATG